MASVSVVCPACGARLKAPNELALCPRCGKLVGGGSAHTEDWYYQAMGQEVGPLAFHELRRLAGEKKVGPETPVRMAKGRWLLAERVPGLSVCWSEGLEEWSFVRDGKEWGPVSFQSLKRLLKSGGLARPDLVRWADWESAVSVEHCLANELFPEPLSALEAEAPPDSQAEASTSPLPTAPGPSRRRGPGWLPVLSRSTTVLLFLAYAAGFITALVAVAVATQWFR